MNATNPTGDERDFEALRRAQRAHEPSMEEILASIRAIIADDRETPIQPKPATPQIVYSNDSPAASPRPAAPIAVIAPAVRSEPAPVVSPVPVEPPPQPVKAAAAEPAPRPTLAPVSEPILRLETMTPALAEQEQAFEDTALLSEDADQAVAASFEALSASVAARSAELVEQMTREMLRPMIKGWLDEHLPAMVERLVRAEIQRVARGQRL